MPVYKSNITGDDLYAYSFASTATDFRQFLSAINWDSANQRWDFIERNGDKATGTPISKSIIPMARISPSSTTVLMI